MPLYETSVTDYLLFLTTLKALEGRINPGIILVFVIAACYKYIANKYLKMNCRTNQFSLIK